MTLPGPGDIYLRQIADEEESEERAEREARRVERAIDDLIMHGDEREGE